jgi:putative oxidoreductase
MNGDDVLKLVGRFFMGVLFVLAGANKIGAFAGFAAMLGSQGLPVPEVLTALTIVVELGCGLALMVGFQARLAAIALAGFTVIATYVGHQFWAIPDPAAAEIQMIMFLKNVAIFGGLLFVASAGPGRFALGGR